MKLVLDTNVVIDWLVFDDPYLAAFRHGVVEGRITVVTHQPAADELRRVLGYRELKLSEERQAGVLARYESQAALMPAIPVELPERFPKCRDPDDNHFLALAWHTKADALVSRDLAVLKLAKRAKKFGFQVLTVQQMVAALDPVAGAAADAVISATAAT